MVSEAEGVVPCVTSEIEGAISIFRDVRVASCAFESDWEHAASLYIIPYRGSQGLSQGDKSNGSSDLSNKRSQRRMMACV